MARPSSYNKHPVKNIELRMYIAECGISYRQIADHIYMSQSQLSQIMQSDIPTWRRKEILGAILEIRNERGDFDDVKEGIRDSRVGGSMGNNVDDAHAEAVRI